MEEEKNQYEFAYDIELTTWNRAFFTVEANSLEEAKKLVHEAAASNTLEDEFEIDWWESIYGAGDPTGKMEVVLVDGWETIYDTEE